jgi:alpha-glucosidase
LYKTFVDIGIAGFWNDMNEPAIFMRADKTMPLNVVHRLDGNRTLDHSAIHNVYGMENVHATFDGLRKLRPNERPFVLTRAAYAGAQRYAATWTGDNSATWNHYRMSIPNLLSLGISGYALVGDDIGGYHGDPPPELLTRWMELGAFNPIDRSHAEKGSADKEPWVHGPEHEAIRRRYNELRYELMPYIYTITEEAATTGVPLMRPMFLEFPEAQNLTGNDTEFLFGPDLLVAPKMFETTEPYNVNLPPGIWYDYWTGTAYPGSRSVKVNPPLDVLPLYVRGGAILPQQPVVQNTGEKANGPLTLRVYPGEHCHGSIYLDDGHTYNFMHGESLRTDYTCQQSADGLTLTISPRRGTFKPWWDATVLEIYGMKTSPREVRAGNRSIATWKFHEKNHSLKVTLPEAPEGTQVGISFPAQ